MSDKLKAFRDKHNGTVLISEESDKGQDLIALQKETYAITGESDSEDRSSESVVSDHEATNENESSDEDEVLEDEEITENVKHKGFICEALGDFSAQESGDLTFKEGDVLTVISVQASELYCAMKVYTKHSPVATNVGADGWWEAEDSNGHKGIVPSSFLKVPDRIQKYVDGASTGSNHETRQLWQKLCSTIKQNHNVEEIISAMGALPIGFCQASLKQLLDEDSRYTSAAFLTPKLSDSGLKFQDIYLSTNTKSLKPITTPLERAIRLVAFRQVCLPGPGFEVSSRHVRICLHDGSKVLSNIHTIRAQFDPKSPKIWTFLPKILRNGSCLEEGQFFIRSNITSPTIGILFQLCISYTKIATSEVGEMSCGWVFMRLLDDSGISVSNRTKVLRIHRGMPFVSQNSSASTTGAKSGPLNVLLNRGKTPRLVVTLSTFKRKLRPLLNFLPTVLIGPVSSIPLLVLYRKILGNRLLKVRSSFDSTDIIQSPFLACFSKMFEQPDILDAFRKCWSDKGIKTKQSDLKSEEHTRMSFQQVFMETAFLLLHCNALPTYALGNIQIEKERKIEILHIMKIIIDQGPLAFTISSEYEFHPISLQELSLNIVGQHCFAIDNIH